ncbi:MAG: enoyl-CoA hydratase/isomerase family protein [Deltaproteobacteria bacterium]|nr:enoyl-CoA hydratase/isomerase family protein [Deltaproteobacteria bacterium]
MSDTVLLEVDEGVATITLNRPERLNCIDIPTLDRLVSLLDEAAASKDVRVVVLAGRGRAFCAGADQGEMVQRCHRQASRRRGRRWARVGVGLRLSACRARGAVLCPFREDRPAGAS